MKVFGLCWDCGIGYAAGDEHIGGHGLDIPGDVEIAGPHI